MAKTYSAIAFKFKDKDGNSGEGYTFDKSTHTEIIQALPQVEKNKEDIAKIKTIFPDIDAGGGTPIDFDGFAKLAEANTFTEANTFAQKVTINVDQTDIAAIGDNEAVTGKALKALQTQAQGKENFKIVDAAPDVGTMDVNVIYFFPSPEATAP